MAHDKDITLTIPFEALVDQETRLQYADKLLELQRSLLEPSSAGLALSTHQRIELQKLLLRYEADAANINIFGSRVAEDRALQYAGITARIELLNHLLTIK